MSKAAIPMPYIKVGINLCQFEGFHCFGCCGYEFKGKEKAAESLIRQTKEYKDYSDSKFKRVEFRERFKFDDLNNCNFCRNYILTRDYPKEELMSLKKVEGYCPLHPLRNSDHDLRASHCDHDYMCKMQKAFLKMDQKDKQKFISWLKERIGKQDIDWYSYSVNMDTDVFYKETFVK